MIVGRAIERLKIRRRDLGDTFVDFEMAALARTIHDCDHGFERGHPGSVQRNSETITLVSAARLKRFAIQARISSTFAAFGGGFGSNRFMCDLDPL